RPDPPRSRTWWDLGRPHPARSSLLRLPRSHRFRGHSFIRRASRLEPYCTKGSWETVCQRLQHRHEAAQHGFTPPPGRTAAIKIDVDRSVAAPSDTFVRLGDHASRLVHAPETQAIL